MTSSTHLNGFKSSLSSTTSSNFRRSASLSDFNSFPNSSCSTSRLDESLLDHGGGGGGGPPLRGLPVVIVMAKGSELTEDKLEDLRQLGRELAISLQSPFVDLPELEAMEEMALNANGVSWRWRCLLLMGRFRQTVSRNVVLDQSNSIFPTVTLSCHHSFYRMTKIIKRLGHFRTSKSESL